MALRMPDVASETPFSKGGEGWMKAREEGREGGIKVGGKKGRGEGMEVGLVESTRPTNSIH